MAFTMYCRVCFKTNATALVKDFNATMSIYLVTIVQSLDVSEDKSYVSEDRFEGNLEVFAQW